MRPPAPTLTLAANGSSLLAAQALTVGTRALPVAAPLGVVALLGIATRGAPTPARFLAAGLVAAAVMWIAHVATRR